MAADAGRQQLIRRQRIAGEQHADQLVDVEAHADRAAQGDLLRGVAADHWIVEIEVRERDTGRAEADMPDAACREVRAQLAVFHDAPRVVAAERDQVEVALRKGEDFRLRFLDDADLDASDLRERLAAHAAHQLLLGGIGALREHDLAVGGIRLQHDARRGAPFLEPVRPGAHRLPHDVGSRDLDRLPRDGHHRQTREAFEHRVVRMREPQDERVAIRRAQALDRRVVVEPAAGLARRVHDRPGTYDQVGERRIAAGAQVRVDRPLDRVHVIGGDELARLALERRGVGEEDSLPQSDRPGLAVVGDRRHRFGGVRDYLRARRQVFELVQRFEDRRGDARGVEVGSLLRIETRDVGRGDAEYLGRVRGVEAAARAGRDHEGDERMAATMRWSGRHA